jgi:hypothetical protein
MVVELTLICSKVHIIKLKSFYLKMFTKRGKMMDGVDVTVDLIFTAVILFTILIIADIMYTIGWL